MLRINSSSQLPCSGDRFGGVETFTLLTLLYIGSGEFGLTHRVGFTEINCHLRALRIERTRGRRAWCFSGPDEPTWTPGKNRISPGFECAYCGPLPGRPRV